MSLGYNSINLVGRITADPELKKTKSDSAYCRFSIAVNRGKHPTTGENMVDFFDCITWNESAENLVKYQGKGSKVLVAGRIVTGSYTHSKHEDVNIKTYEVVADNILFLESAKAKAESEGIPEPTESPF